MSEAILCNPCQNLFSGRSDLVNENDTRLYWHHKDSESLQDALSLPCGICNLLWGDEVRASKLYNEIPAQSQCYVRGIYPKDGDNSGERAFCFGNGDFPHSWAPTLHLSSWDGKKGYHNGNTLSANTRSDSALGFLSKKYAECQDEHLQCKVRQHIQTWYPSRLLYVGKETSDLVYLRDTQNLVDDGGYFTLSHCWGQLQPYALRKETESILRRGIPVNELSKTFQDAIYITRKFGVKYLWIDSLLVYQSPPPNVAYARRCIFQDSIHDWSTEATSMRDIYSRSRCKIAATAAADGDGGLFFDRNVASVSACKVEIKWSSDRPRPIKDDFPADGTYWCDREKVWDDCVEEAPLNLRAWVKQERHLSPKTMHFGASLLFWECEEQTASEIYQTTLPDWARPYWGNDSSMLKRTISDFRKAISSSEVSTEPSAPGSLHQDTDTIAKIKDRIYHAWGVFRISYTNCQMTKDEDKLVALQGVAQEVSEALDDQLVAGLWRSRIVEELCWFSFVLQHEPNATRPMKGRAPTWSWASLNGKIWISTLTKLHRRCPERRILAECHSLDVKTKISGEVTSASLLLNCKLISATMNLNPESLNDLQNPPPSTSTLETNQVEAFLPGLNKRIYPKVHFDIPADKKNYAADVWFVIIQTCKHEDNQANNLDERSSMEGLLIRRIDEEADDFERLGLLEASNQCMESLLEAQSTVESRAITLM